MSKQKKKIIEIEWPILHGTISTARGKCGQKNCRCQTDPKALHGPYYRWTGRLKGKITTKTLTQKMAQECEKRIRRYQKFQKEMEKILAEASDSAPWIENPKK